MCYYNGVRVSKAELMDLLGAERQIEEWESIVQSGFDYEQWPIVVSHSGELELQMAHWEFIPYWYKSMKEVAEGRKKYTTLNAVGEKLLESRIYAEAARKRRCLVLSSGFYEWRHYKPQGAKKEFAYPYHITLKDVPLFFMAGIWQPWTDKETGEHLTTFALITTEANTLMEQIHNKKRRMPTILTKKLATEWLCPELSDERICQLATFQIPSSAMQAHTISKDFRAALNPLEEHRYEDLPALELSV